MLPHVLVPVGGSGTGMYPLSLNHPKHLVELCDTAIIAVSFRLLAEKGCRKFILGCKGVDNSIELSNYFKAGEGFFKRLEITDHEDFCYQPHYDDRGSADSLCYCMKYFNIDDNLFVISGDILIDIDLNKFVKFHHEHKALVTIALKKTKPKENISQYGIAWMEEDGRITRFIEKPENGSADGGLISTGFYLFSPDILGVIKKRGESTSDIGADLIPYLVNSGIPIYGYSIDGYWIKIGTPEQLHRATMDILSGKINHYPKKYLYNEDPNQWIHPSTLKKIQKDLGNKITLKGNVYIGRNCDIGEDTIIENSHIGHHSIIKNNVKISNSLIMSFSNINRGVKMNYAVVGRHSTIGTNCELKAYPKKYMIPVIGEGVNLAEESIVRPGVRVAPQKLSSKIQSLRRFIELGTDERGENYFFKENIR
jgi:NDP-sugar pyrophosphorylase family protein